ncbi:MAG: GIY-YIG nuclease family protein [Deltaproteobacteria bacterium]|nr:GIY-YIG nuclease family protein [Deltaproteobacteria bacterium]
MPWVYVIKSVPQPSHHYVGSTRDVRRRLIEHNAGKSPHTSKYAPWRIVLAIWLADAERAFQFERYLKSGSGRAFARRHLL